MYLLRVRTTTDERSKPRRVYGVSLPCIKHSHYSEDERASLGAVHVHTHATERVKLGLIAFGCRSRSDEAKDAWRAHTCDAYLYVYCALRFAHPEHQYLDQLWTLR